MSEKQEAQIIQFPQAEVSEEDFQIFLKALLGPYKGVGYLAE